MVAQVRINYDRYVNAGITDFENSVMDDVLEWANATFDTDVKIALADLIELYWGVQLGEFEIVPIEDDDD